MRKITLLPVAALALLAACTGSEINQPPVAYTPTKTLNEVSTTTFTVRAYLRASGERNELTGVSCSFQGQGFKSSFVTPAVVMAPNMQLRTPPASVTCTYNGQTKTKVLTPYNKTVDDIQSQAMGYGAGAGLVGVLVGGAIAASQTSSRNTALDIWAYPDAAVEFTQ